MMSIADLAQLAPGEDCTEDESARIKRFLAEQAGGSLHWRLAERWPTEWAEVQDEFEFNRGFNEEDR